MGEASRSKTQHIINSQIRSYIQLLDLYLSNSKDVNKLQYIESRDWMQNCIECLNFALNNEKLLKAKPSLYVDTLETLNLLYSWIIEEKSWAYIALREKFKPIYTGKEIGNAFREIFNKIKTENKEATIEVRNSKRFFNNDGNFKSIAKILNEISDEMKFIMKP
jgi:hypothetical protein